VRNRGSGKYSAVFAKPNEKDNAIWGPVFEKAWAKVKGNYLNAEGGFNEEGIRSLTGIPVFDYKINSSSFDVLFNAYKSEYILSVSTSEGSD
jgi:hypothetical protein